MSAFRLGGLALLCALSLAASGCATTAASVVPDPAAAEWKHLGGTDYEKTNPGLGRSDRYSSDFAWADVYVYGYGINDWKEGLRDERLPQHFQQVIGDVYAAEKQGVYRGVRLLSEADDCAPRRHGGEVCMTA